MQAQPRLAPDLLAMVDKGVSVIVASRDAAGRPSLMRAVGSRIDPDGRALSVYLARRQSRQLLQDLATTGHVAVVFSEPSSHRSVQLKARHVHLRPVEADDRVVLQRYLASMEHELALIGISPPLTRAMLAHDFDDMVAVSFEPTQAYEQTPGPRAGTML